MKRDPEKEQFWRGAIVEAEGSGMSVRAFCQQKGLKEGLFHAWRRQIRVRDAGTNDQPGFIELVRPANIPTTGVSIRIDDRISIVLQRGFDRETLREALACLPAGAGGA
jgi:transposase-like protein